jgi:hypothetical protein
MQNKADNVSGSQAANEASSFLAAANSFYREGVLKIEDFSTVSPMDEEAFLAKLSGRTPFSGLQKELIAGICNFDSLAAFIEYGRTIPCAENSESSEKAPEKSVEHYMALVGTILEKNDAKAASLKTFLDGLK